MPSVGKNTIYLYIRSFFILVISLYTSRVLLDKLGVEDYGLYNTIGSVTASLSFLTSSLGLATSRFLTYNLGTGNCEAQKNTFGNIIFIYLSLALIIVIFLEAIGPWFINNKLVIPSARVASANSVFHISVATIVLSMLTTPFTSLVIAHEKMNFFALSGVIDVITKLIICFVISIASFDKLTLYACLLFFIQLLLLLVNFCYCKTHFEETIIKIKIEKETIRQIGAFSLWSLVGQFSAMLRVQGSNIITNIFFGSAVVAARAISTQVEHAVNSFVNNFMTAVNPQILKRYAAGNDVSSNGLVQKSTVVSFVLATVICFPVALNANFILHVWLKEVPAYAVPFVQVVMMQSIFGTIENGLYSIFYSRGRVKENALVTPVLGIIMFMVVYVLFKLGYSPMALSYAYLIWVLLSCFLVKPILVHKLFGYGKEFFYVIDIACIKMIISMIPVLLVHTILLKSATWGTFIIETFSSCLYIILISYFFIIDKRTRYYVKSIMSNKVIHVIRK